MYAKGACRAGSSCVFLHGKPGAASQKDPPQNPPGSETPGGNAIGSVLIQLDTDDNNDDCTLGAQSKYMSEPQFFMLGNVKNTNVHFGSWYLETKAPADEEYPSLPSNKNAKPKDRICSEDLEWHTQLAHYNAFMNWCEVYEIPVSYTHLTLPTNREV